jgi:hypothetical protein
MAPSFLCPTPYEFLWVKMMFSLYLILLKDYGEEYLTGIIFREKKFRYGIPAYTDPFRILLLREIMGSRK